MICSIFYIRCRSSNIFKILDLMKHYKRKPNLKNTNFYLHHFVTHLFLYQYLFYLWAEFYHSHHSKSLRFLCVWFKWARQFLWKDCMLNDRYWGELRVRALYCVTLVVSYYTLRARNVWTDPLSIVESLVNVVTICTYA